LIGDSTKQSTNSITYDNINDELLNSVVDEVNHFIDILFSINDTMNFKKYFGVNSAHFESYKEILRDETLNFLDVGISQKRDSLQGNTNIPIEESLFFYPLVGALNKLSYQIVTELNK